MNSNYFKKYCTQLFFLLAFLGSSSIDLTAQRDPFAGQTSVDVSATPPNELPSFEAYRNEPENIKVDIVGVKELYNILQSSRDRLHILDTRSRTEYTISHIKDARPAGFLDFSAERVWMLNRSARIIVYSATESRSRTVAQYLKLMGFLDVQILENGLIGWKNAGQPIFDQKGKTDRIHVGKRANTRLVKRGLVVLE